MRTRLVRLIDAIRSRLGDTGADCGPECLCHERTFDPATDAYPLPDADADSATDAHITVTRSIGFSVELAVERD